MYVVMVAFVNTAEKELLPWTITSRDKLLNWWSLLDQYNLNYSLMSYADDVMFYQEPTGHDIRTENWIQVSSESQRQSCQNKYPLLVKHQNLMLSYDSYHSSDREKHPHSFGQMVGIDLKAFACKMATSMNIAQAGKQ